MKILWFTNTFSNYKDNKVGYNGGGWISSLESVITCEQNVELGICFLDDSSFCERKNNVTYYGVKKIYCNSLFKLLNLSYKLAWKNELKSWKYYEEAFFGVINSFKPDVVHVFGLENYFGLIGNSVNIPVVLHIQGILGPCGNAFLPPFYSIKRWTKNFLHPFFYIKRIRTENMRKLAILREEEIFKRVNYYMGRTTWDYRLSQLFNNESVYFHVDEILRETFYDSKSKREIPNELTIVTTISNAPYKGFDLILKTAALLKKQYGYSFVWNCFGNINPDDFEKLTGLKAADLNVRLNGIATADRLKDAILKSTLYFHTSYIDNSPNSLCEAQILGIPTIATNVGGVSSLIEEGKTGYLIPANDPYQATYLINKLYSDINLNRAIGEAGKQVALKRHNKSTITNNIICCYKELITSCK